MLDTRGYYESTKNLSSDDVPVWWISEILTLHRNSIKQCLRATLYYQRVIDVFLRILAGQIPILINTFYFPKFPLQFQMDFISLITCPNLLPGVEVHR